MIEVPFDIERHDAESHNPLSTWIQRNWDMPWLMYLLKHTKSIETEHFYDAPRDMYEVRFRFYLDPKQETYYRLKFNC